MLLAACLGGASPIPRDAHLVANRERVTEFRQLEAPAADWHEPYSTRRRPVRRPRGGESPGEALEG